MATILVGYWLENGVVGLLNVPKILLAGRHGPNAPPVAISGALAAFFVLHYGLFWLVHGVFVFVLTWGSWPAQTDRRSTAGALRSWPCCS